MAGWNAGSITSKLLLDKAKWSASVKAVEKNIKSLGSKITQNSASFKKHGRSMTIAGGAIVAAFGLMISKYAKAGDEIDKMAKRTGFAATTLSELKYAAEISGASLTSLEKGVKKMSKSLTDASIGLETYVRSFDRIGLSVEELMALSPEEQFMKIAEGIAALESPTLRAATAQEIFGRAGTELLPLFAEGTEGMEALRQKAHELGIVFDEEAAAKAAKLVDAQTTLKASLQGVTIAIAENLAPALTKLAEGLAETIGKIGAWIKEHPKLTEIIAKAVLGLGALMLALGPLLMALPGLVIIIPKIGIAIKALLGPWGLLVAAIGVITAKLIEAIGTFNKFKTALEDYLDVSGKKMSGFEKAWASLTATIQKHVYGVDAAKFATEKYAEMTDEARKKQAEMAETTLDAIKKTGLHTEVIDSLKGAFGWLIPKIDDTAGALVKFNSTLKTTVSVIENDFGRAGRDMTDILDWINTSIPTTTIPAFRDLSGVLYNVQESFQDLTIEERKLLDDSKKVTKRMKSVWETFADGLRTKWGSTFGEILRTTTSFKDGLKNIWDAIVVQFTDMIGQMSAKWMTNFIGKILSSLTSKFIPGVEDAMEDAASSAAGASTSIGASMAAAFNVGIIAAWATAAWSVISGWGDQMNIFWEEQRGLIDDYIAKLKKMGRTWREIKDLLAQEEYVSPRPRPPIDEDKTPGKGGGKGGRWATGFEGIIDQPTVALMGESGPEYVSVRPLSQGQPSAASNVTVNNNVILNGTIITDRDYTRKRMIPEILSALESNLDKTRFKEALGVA